MQGFADLDDLDLIPTRDVARRMGYGSPGSLRRFLVRGGAGLPPSLRRGWHRAGDVKLWYALLPTLRPAASPPGAFCAAASARAPVFSLDAARLKRKLAAV